MTERGPFILTPEGRQALAKTPNLEVAATLCNLNNGRDDAWDDVVRFGGTAPWLTFAERFLEKLAARGCHVTAGTEDQVVERYLRREEREASSSGL